MKTIHHQEYQDAVELAPSVQEKINTAMAAKADRRPTLVQGILEDLDKLSDEPGRAGDNAGFARSAVRAIFE